MICKSKDHANKLTVFNLYNCNLFLLTETGQREIGEGEGGRGKGEREIVKLCITKDQQIQETSNRRVVFSLQILR